MVASYATHKAHWGDQWVCTFLIDGKADRTARGTDGTGCKLYDTEAKAIAAGKRYITMMRKNGFK